MASWVQNMGLSKGSHLVEGSTLMPKWEDRSGIAIAENNINLLPKNVAQDPMLAKGALMMGGHKPHSGTGKRHAYPGCQGPPQGWD